MTDLPDSLQPNHPVLIDGLNDGFRAPDLGWVGTQRPTEVLPEHFRAGSLVFSNWWVGSKAAALALAQSLVEAFQEDLSTMTPLEAEEAFIPVVSVGYWTHPTADLALVGQQSMTEDYMLGHEWPKTFRKTEALDESLTRVGMDGNDNSPHMLVEGLDEAADLGHPLEAVLELYVSASIPDLAEALREIAAENQA